MALLVDLHASASYPAYTPGTRETDPKSSVLCHRHGRGGPRRKTIAGEQCPSSQTARRRIGRALTLWRARYTHPSPVRPHTLARPARRPFRSTTSVCNLAAARLAGSSADARSENAKARTRWVRSSSPVPTSSAHLARNLSPEVTLRQHLHMLLFQQTTICCNHGVLTVTSRAHGCAGGASVHAPSRDSAAFGRRPSVAAHG